MKPNEAEGATGEPNRQGDKLTGDQSSISFAAELGCRTPCQLYFTVLAI